MKDYSSREIVKILEKSGWQLIRVNGDHHHFRNMKTGKMTTVPHPNKSLPKGTVKAISRQTGIKF
ncbi:MAG: type II toxin-antitoxin system HicA family toxin [Oscillospiraceae bacterium]|nr:type II toxin-antitoxin system HicA family toxin [Oscillospiraceae bacterium]